MEAVGRLAGGIAHDFNNVLGVILGYAELALDQAADDSGLAITLEHIKAAVQKASGLTRQLLTFSSKQPTSIRRLDLNEVVCSMLQLLKRIVGENITIRTHAQEGAAWVSADRTQLEQILMNFAANSRDAMPSGGEITITTGVAQAGDHHATRDAVTEPPTNVTLSFRDTGCGMDMQTKLHIFEPFFTTKPPGYGTGLGLSTVYNIVNQNGATVSVNSEPGKGSTFRLCFPAAAGRGKMVHRKSAKSRRAATSGSVLILEADPLLRSMTAAQLREAGYKAIEAESAAVAFETLKREEVNLVLSDVVMPNLRGDEFATQLRSENPSLKVLLMSGYGCQLTSKRLGKNVQAIEKPFTRRALLSKVNALLRT